MKNNYKEFTDGQLVKLLLIQEVANKIIDDIETYRDGENLAGASDNNNYPKSELDAPIPETEAPVISIGPSGIRGYCQREWWGHRN